MIDIDKLRTLLAAVPCAEQWGHGAVSGCIETSQRASNGDIYGLTQFEPDEVNAQTIAEAELACAAVAAGDCRSGHGVARRSAASRASSAVAPATAVDAARKAGT